MKKIEEDSSVASQFIPVFRWGVVAVFGVLIILNGVQSFFSYEDEKREIIDTFTLKTLDKFTKIEHVTMSAYSIMDDIRSIVSNYFVMQTEEERVIYEGINMRRIVAGIRYNPQEDYFYYYSQRVGDLMGATVLGAGIPSEEAPYMKEVGMLGRIFEHYRFRQSEVISHISQGYYVSKNGLLTFAPELPLEYVQNFTKEEFEEMTEWAFGREYWRAITPEENPDGDVQWSAPYKDIRSDNHILTVGFPIYLGGEFVAGMFLDIQTGFFEDIMSEESEIDDFWVLYDTDLKPLSYSTQHGSNRLLPLVNELTEDLKEADIAEATIGQSRYTTYYIKPLENYPGYMVTAFPSSRINQVTKKIGLNSLLISGIILLLGVATYRIALAILVKPASAELAKLSASEEGIRKLLDSMPVPTILVSIEKKILLYCNNQMVNNFSLEEGSSLVTQFTVEQNRKAIEDIFSIFEADKKIDNHEQLFYIKGEEAWFSVSAVELIHNQSVVLLVSFNNITLRKKKELELTDLATQDPLTGIYNRRYFIELAERSFNSRRKDDFFTVISFDLDHFKKINDTWGHKIGDRALKEFVNTVVYHLRKEDTFARWGGEEFVLLLHNTEERVAFEIAERIRKAVMEIRIPVKENETCQFTVSCGLVYGGASYKSVHEAIELSDKALYQAKERGRNQVVVYQEP